MEFLRKNIALGLGLTAILAGIYVFFSYEASVEEKKESRKTQHVIKSEPVTPETTVSSEKQALNLQESNVVLKNETLPVKSSRSVETGNTSSENKNLKHFIFEDEISNYFYSENSEIHFLGDLERGYLQNTKAELKEKSLIPVAAKVSTNLSRAEPKPEVSAKAEQPRAKSPLPESKPEMSAKAEEQPRAKSPLPESKSRVSAKAEEQPRAKSPLPESRQQNGIAKEQPRAKSPLPESKQQNGIAKEQQRAKSPLPESKPQVSAKAKEQPRTKSPLPTEASDLQNEEKDQFSPLKEMTRKPSSSSISTMESSGSATENKKNKKRRNKKK